MTLPRPVLLLLPLLLGCGTAKLYDSGASDETEVPEDCESDPESLWYLDEDGDGYGGEEVWASCPPESGVEIGGDCDDGNEFTWPGAEDVCDGRDNDCNGAVDDGEAGTLSVWYFDADDDGYGHVSASIDSCGEPEGYSANNLDCDDNNGGVYPGAPEICDGFANDCDGTGWVTDDGTATFYSSDEETHTDVSALMSQDPEAPLVLTLEEEGTLTICEATWHTRIVLAASVTVTGVSGPEAVILDAGGDGPAITVQSGHSASIRNLKLTGGSAERGGGVYVEPIVCSTDEEKDTGDVDTGGADDTGSKEGEVDQPIISLSGVEITGNAASAEGGGVFTDTCSGLYVYSSTISGNSAASGGGLYVGSGDEVDLYLSESTISGNTATASGGGLYIGTNWVSLSESTISENTAATGGGLALSGYLYLSIDDDEHLDITGNTATTGGGAYLYAESWLYSEGVDWGGEEDKETKKTSADNTPADIDGESLLKAPYSFGLSETFTCTDKKGCVVDEDKKKKKE